MSRDGETLPLLNDASNSDKFFLLLYTLSNKSS